MMWGKGEMGKEMRNKRKRRDEGFYGNSTIYIINLSALHFLWLHLEDNRFSLLLYLNDCAGLTIE